MKTQVTSNDSAILALDVGDRRIGVAIAGSTARLPRPLITLVHDEHVIDTIVDLVTDQQATAVVVGLPRGMEGQETKQTAIVREFASKLQAKTAVPVHFQDEAVTSKLAEQELAKRGKVFDKQSIDSLAATYILDDYFAQQKRS